MPITATTARKNAKIWGSAGLLCGQGQFQRGNFHLYTI